MFPSLQLVYPLRETTQQFRFKTISGMPLLYIVVVAAGYLLSARWNLQKITKITGPQEGNPARQQEFIQPAFFSKKNKNKSSWITLTQEIRIFLKMFGLVVHLRQYQSSTSFFSIVALCFMLLPSQLLLLSWWCCRCCCLSWQSASSRITYVLQHWPDISHLLKPHSPSNYVAQKCLCSKFDALKSWNVWSGLGVEILPRHPGGMMMLFLSTNSRI